MRYSFVGELPRHLYVWIDTSFTHKEPVGWIPAVWFGLVSYPGRAWGLTVLLECGAVYRNLPPHAVAFEPRPDPWSIEAAQTWDCYGWDFATLEYRYLSGLRCVAKTSRGCFEGVYLFTAAPVGDGFSAYPEQAKEFSFVQLDNGRLTIQPTNHLVLEERSFTQRITGEFPKGLARQTDVWDCE